MAHDWQSFRDVVGDLNRNSAPWVAEVADAVRKSAVSRWAGHGELVVFPFGSSANGFADLSSDIDISLCLRDRDREGQAKVGERPLSKSMPSKLPTCRAGP